MSRNYCYKVSLDKEEDTRVKKAAKEEGSKVAPLIRRAVLIYLREKSIY